MGLGKTVQAAAAIRILCLQRQVQGALLVVPASLLDQWRRELRRWAPELRVVVVRGSATDRAWQWRGAAHIKVVSYETLRIDNESSIGWARQQQWDLVVLDEAQKIKNRDSSVSRVCKLMSRQRSWAMTGTPLENSVDDLASILEFVDHDPAGEVVRFRPGPAMLERHRELQLRRRKADVLADLPPKQIIRLSLPLLPDQQVAYDRAEREGVLQLRAKGAEVRIQHVLELILRLKQLCNFNPATGESAKLLDIRERLEVLRQEGHRALVFSQFTDETFGVRAAAHRLAEFDPLIYTGEMSGPERDRTVQLFKTQPQHGALLLSLRAGGVGINLQEASYVFHLDRWWNPAVERQAEDRSHRMGQVYPVTVFTYTCEGTIEQRIDEILSAKQALFDEVVDDVSIDLGTRLNADELFGLFGLAAPTTGAKARPRASTGLELEDRCAALLSAAGWTVEPTPRSRDGGVDLIAERVDEMGLAQRLFVQCKDHARPVGVDVVRELLGVLPPGEHVRAVLAAPGGVTADARRLADTRDVVVWDEEHLAKLEAHL
jgi:SNF2 family DNA or RNA helicase